MKPISNRIYCLGCNHTKILFETEAKANNFIRFNSEEIFNATGKAPTRSYYCTFCCGWHVTSIENLERAYENDVKDASKWEVIFTKHNNHIQHTLTLINASNSSDPFFLIDSLCQQCRDHITNLNLEEALAIFKDILLEETFLKAKGKIEKIKIEKIRNRERKVRYLQSAFDIIAAYDINSETRLAYINKGEYSKNSLAKIYLQGKENLIGSDM